jgi:hypothetical protein
MRAWMTALLTGAVGIGLAGGTAGAKESKAASEPKLNVVAEQVRPIEADQELSGMALLVVLVVDDLGDPIDTVPVTVLRDGKPIASQESDPRGRALFRLALTGTVVVHAEDTGLVPSEARSVQLRQGGLTAVVLPLADAEEPAQE